MIAVIVVALIMVVSIIILVVNGIKQAHRPYPEDDDPEIL